MSYKKLYTHPSYTPIEISTDAEMASVLTDESNLGKVYLFTGTTGTYTNGDLYEVGLISAGFANDSWETIHYFVSHGLASTVYNIGDTKSVTLTSAVLGTTTHNIQIIDIDKDASNTITCQTQNLLANTTAFGSSSVWSSSTVRTLCQNYYSYAPFKDYIQTVSKGTNTEYNTSSVVYSDETVFLPSIYEMGLSSYSYKPVGAEYTNGVSTSYAYYTSDSTRIKKQGDSGSAYYYWTRSRSSDYSDYVCNVRSDGTAYDHSYINYDGLAPAFVIG